MGRQMRVLDPTAGPIERFACELRALRATAGEPPFWKMARRCEVSKSALAAAVAGYQIPSEKVARNFVLACGGDWPHWRERWSRAIAEVAATGKKQGDPHRHGRVLVPVEDSARQLPQQPTVAPALPSAVADHPAQDGRVGRRWWCGKRRLIGAGALLSVAAVIVLLSSSFAPSTNLVTGTTTWAPTGSSATGETPGDKDLGNTGRSTASGASQQAWSATSGPSCSTSDAVAMDTSGYWTPLPGSATGSCGEALIHRTTDSGDGANWVFYPGVGKTCTFQIDIPNSSVITAKNATYQAWDTLPGEHYDTHRIGANVSVNQQANRGGTITITFGPTKNGTIDLQLYDNYPDHMIEVADTVTATCR